MGRMGTGTGYTTTQSSTAERLAGFAEQDTHLVTEGYTCIMFRPGYCNIVQSMYNHFHNVNTHINQMNFIANILYFFIICLLFFSLFHILCIFK